MLRQPLIPVAVLLALCASFVAASDRSLLMLEGENHLLQNDPREALRKYRAADEAEESPCGECLLGQARAFNAMGAFKNARERASEAIELLRGTVDEASAQNVLGLAHYANGNAKEDGLRAAAAAFEHARELSDAPNTYYNLGMVLLRLEKDAEGLEQMRIYLELDPEGQFAAKAKEYLESPERSRGTFLPAFEVVTLDGEFITTEDLEGKVVLIDFWGTWCAPCVAAIPSLRRIAKRHEDDPFVLLSISNDAAEQTVRSFVAEHQMTWPQVWDERSNLTRNLFAVRTFPTYLVVAPNGEITHLASGGGRSIEQQLSSRVGRAVRSAKKAQRR
ncbi:MAG: redoxin domain-containing protein [Acidobacteriota bacterium]